MALSNKKYNSDELGDGERPLRLQHRFLVLRKLGEGTYGKVQLALNKETNEEVAVKTIKKAKIEIAEDMLRIRREIHIMAALRHPHIIHINEVFETRQKIVIAMQYASGGELYDYLGCHQTLPEDEARRLFRQIASAIYYCHKNQICHRDLKLENILLDEEGNAQIADFGLSNIFDEKRRMNTFCGSPLYASPEIVKGTPYKGPEVDCWSLGVLLYTLVYGTMPFDGRSFKELVSQISEGRYEEPINRSNASSLIRWLLTPDIARRATITDVCKDSWVNQGYDTSLLEVAENMALMTGLPPREQISATKLSIETNTKNGREKSIFRKAAAQLQENAGKFTSLFTKNIENNAKTNDINSQTRKSILYDQITNYDVRFVLNKLIAAVEASLNADKNSRNLTMKGNMATVCNVNRKENASEKIDSAYVIPIFEVTSVIPNERNENTKIVNEKSEKAKRMSIIPNEIPTISISENENCNQSVQIKILSKDSTKKQRNSENRNSSMYSPDIQPKNLSADGCPRSQILTESQKQFYSLNISGQPDVHKTDFQTRKIQHDHPLLHHPLPKANRMNDGFPLSHKHPGPFMRTKHHVLSLARLLSLNYEKLMRKSFRMQPCKRKLPGKITIPPTFDPNNPPTATKKQQEDKKEVLIFPTVSVSENKEKIEKKIEKIKKAALNKNIIIRSDSKTRMRIEKYIRSQVKKIQDLVCEEQRSIHASLEHLDEQSFRDMSEMYYCAFGSENTDSGIANTEEEEYFCFLCSKPNDIKGATGFIDAFVLESIKKGCLYTSNHLHIPRAKEQNRWGYTTNNGEFGSLSKCKSEIEFPIEYLNYISSNNTKSDLNKRTHHKQQIQRSNIGNTKCFSTIASTIKSDGSNTRILRSASDSVGLNLSKNTFEILKLNTDGHDNILQNYSLLPHFLEQSLSNGCNYSQMTDYDTQSTATDATFINTSHMLDKDDGIGDSNDSFQSYIETLENNIENDVEIPHLNSSYSYTNFMKESFNNKLSSTKMFSEPHLKSKYEIEYDDFRRQNCEPRETLADILDSTSWVTNLEKEKDLPKHRNKNEGLRRRNTMTCIRDRNEMDENFKFDQTSTEFENYLWHAYKEHLLEDNQRDAEYSSSPNLNYYSLDKKAKFRSRDSKSMDINGESSNDFVTKRLSNISATSEQDSNVTSSITLKNILKHSSITKNLPEMSASHLSRTKSIHRENYSDRDRDDIIQKLRAERKLSMGSNVLDVSNGSRPPFMSNFLNDLEKKEQGRKTGNSNRRCYLKNNLPLSKLNKSEYKKSFLQLLALKRIQEAEKELDKSPRSVLPNAEENSGSLLEALKTHGYKNVISQRFQDTGDDDYLDPFHMKYLKSSRNLRAELARLNYMYYESLPRYTLDPYDENDYLYDDLDYSRVLNGLSTPSFYDMPNDYRKQMPTQSVYDWLDTAQIDEYLNTLRSDLLYNPEETVTSDTTHRCCAQWGRENYRFLDDESPSESPDNVEETPSKAFSGYLKNKELNSLNETINPMNNERSQMHSTNTDDERQESVHDRIWRKSFYSRFNNRALSRKKSSIIEAELSESRLGLLNDLYNNPLKTGFEKSEFLQRDGSNKSFHMRRSKKHSPSFDKFESRSSMQKKYSAKYSKEREIVVKNEASSSSTEFVNVCNTAPENEEPEH